MQLDNSLVIPPYHSLTALGSRNGLPNSNSNLQRSRASPMACTVVSNARQDMPWSSAKAWSSPKAWSSSHWCRATHLADIIGLPAGALVDVAARPVQRLVIRDVGKGLQLRACKSVMITSRSTISRVLPWAMPPAPLPHHQEYEGYVQHGEHEIDKYSIKLIWAAWCLTNLPPARWRRICT